MLTRTLKTLIPAAAALALLSLTPAHPVSRAEAVATPGETAAAPAPRRRRHVRVVDTCKDEATPEATPILAPALAASAPVAVACSDTPRGAR